MLEDLQRRFGSRVRTLTLTGDEVEDRERMKRAAPGPIDCVLDLLPPSAGTKPVRAAAMAVREYGRVLLMGGVGMLGGDDLAPWAAIHPSTRALGLGVTFSIGFACWPDVQLIRHSNQFGERFGFHLHHHAGPVNFNGLLAGTEVSARLFVE